MVPQFLSLSELLISNRKPDSIIAFEQVKPIHWGTFLKHCRVKVMPETKKRGAPRTMACVLAIQITLSRSVYAHCGRLIMSRVLPP